MTPELFQQYEALLAAAVLAIAALEKAKQTVPLHLSAEMEQAVNRMATPLQYIQSRKAGDV